MINTPLFECLERLMRLRNVEADLHGICHDLEFEQYRLVSDKLSNAIGREEVFLAHNVDRWLKEEHE